MTPVLVGYGQVNQDAHAADPVEPVALMAAAAQAAAGPRVLHAVDAIRVVNLLSWRYRDPGLLLGQADRRAGSRHPIHRRRRERAAIAGQSGLPGYPARGRRRGAAGRRRDLANPETAQGQRCSPRLDDAGRGRAVGTRFRRRGRDGGRGGTTDRPGIAVGRVPALRGGVAGLSRRVVGGAPAPHRRVVGTVQRPSPNTTRTRGATRPGRPTRSGSHAPTTG